MVERVLVDGDVSEPDAVGSVRDVAFGVDMVAVRGDEGGAVGEHLVQVGVGEAFGVLGLVLGGGPRRAGVPTSVW